MTEVQEEISPIPTSATQLADPIAQYVRVETSLESTVWARFVEPYLRGIEPFARGFALPTSTPVEDQFVGVPEHLVTRDIATDHSRTVLIEAGSFVALAQRYRHSGQVLVRAASRQDLTAAVARVREWFPEQEPADTEVTVDFWQRGHGMHTTERRIEAPDWTDIARHYPGEVHEALDDLMSLELESPQGRVILWHGPPGTGKTTAIRTLARAWREQARLQVVLDPDTAFVEASSLMQMLLAEDAKGAQWRVLVIEDADRLVDAEARGRALSQLLNVGDGIVGQGVRVLVLLTTNRPPAALHPALSRPGRCLSHVAFRRFTHAEALDAFPERAAAMRPDAVDLSLAEILTEVPDHAASERFGRYL